MCGITGIISKAAISDEQSQQVARLNRLLTHRGPDGEGTFNADHVCMAMRRLSIIDLSTGWQPLYNEDRTLALICNGEIYNFVELRKALEARGHRFSTKSDCETILHLYEEHGDDCVHHLRGMYAFALWDSRRRRLLVVRDRMGEKPLYLVERPGEIWFCSEMRALVQAGVIDMQLDPGAINLYLHYGFVPQSRCPILGVRRLPAGSLLSIDVDQWTIRERPYWRLEDSPPIDGDPATLVREQLEQVSELIIRSDVPVGVSLSGGLDSSLIAVLAQKNYPGTMHAITIGYEGEPWQDERGMARELAQHLGMPIHEVEMSNEEMATSFTQMTLERDEPIDDISGTALRIVMQEAHRQGLPVMLGGLGGDELFWGYAWMRNAAAATKRRQAAHGGNGSAAKLRDYLGVTRPAVSYTGGLRWLKSFGGLRTGLQQWRMDRSAPSDQMVFYDQQTTFHEALDSVSHILSPQFAEQAFTTDPMSLYAMPRPWPNIDVAMIGLICETFLRCNAIPLGDRLSMSSSVEMRLPLVDYRLAETVVGLTKTQPSVAGSAKKWLREAVADIVPSFVTRRRKRGFSPPWRQWGRALQKSHGQSLLDGYLREQGVISESAARAMYKWLAPATLTLPRHIAERVLVLETWCQAIEASRLPALAHEPAAARRRHEALR